MFRKVGLLSSEYFHNPGSTDQDSESFLNAISDLEKAFSSKKKQETAIVQSLKDWHKQIQQAKFDNQQIDKQIIELTDYSAEQSNNYIEQVTKKLLNPEQKDSVTDLEKMVIIGANLNTNGNLTVKNMFYQMIINHNTKGQLIEFLDKTIANAEEDKKNLEGTPFYQLPVKAIEANQTTKKLVFQFSSNLEKKDNAQSNIEQAIASQLNQLEKENLDSQINTAHVVKNSYLQIGGILLIVFIIISGLTGAIARAVSGIIARTVDMLRDISEGEGDLTRRLTVSTKDELGELARWFNLFVEKIQGIVKTNCSECQRSC